MKRSVRKSWWVNIYDQHGQLVIGAPYPTEAACKVMAIGCGQWLGCKEVVFEYEDGYDDSEEDKA